MVLVDRTKFQEPKSNEDRELFAHDLWLAQESYDELAKVSQVPQDAMAATLVPNVGPGMLGFLELTNEQARGVP